MSIVGTIEYVSSGPGGVGGYAELFDVGGDLAVALSDDSEQWKAVTHSEKGQ